MTAAALVRMPRQQVAQRTAGLEAATQDADGALTVEACAMYTQALSTIRQLDRLAAKIMDAEHSHNRAALTAQLQHVRALAGMAMDTVYRVACDSPASKFGHVRDAQDALRAEATGYLWPTSST